MAFWVADLNGGQDIYRQGGTAWTRPQARYGAKPRGVAADVEHSLPVSFPGARATNRCIPWSASAKYPSQPPP
jgi:hypothetical protein